MEYLFNVVRPMLERKQLKLQKHREVLTCLDELDLPDDLRSSVNAMFSDILIEDDDDDVKFMKSEQMKLKKVKS